MPRRRNVRRVLPRRMCELGPTTHTSCLRAARVAAWILIGCKSGSSSSTIVDAGVATVQPPEAAITEQSTPHVVTAVDPPPLDDQCTKHEDCVALDHFVDTDWRCCLGCGGTVASSASWAKVFLEYCAATKAMRECPVPQCDAGTGSAKCIGGRCALIPGRKL